MRGKRILTSGGGLNWYVCVSLKINGAWSLQKTRGIFLAVSTQCFVLSYTETDSSDKKKGKADNTIISFIWHRKKLTNGRKKINKSEVKIDKADEINIKIKHTVIMNRTLHNYMHWRWLIFICENQLQSRPHLMGIKCSLKSLLCRCLCLLTCV